MILNCKLSLSQLLEDLQALWSSNYRQRIKKARREAKDGKISIHQQVFPQN